MRRLSRGRRAFALVWAVLQFALPAASVLGETHSSASAVSGEPSGHVEERSGPGCRPVHPPDCPRCQVLSTHAPVAAAPAVDWMDIASASSTPSDGAGRRGIASRALPLSRAPPLFS